MKLNYYEVNPNNQDHVGFLYLLLSHRRDYENISHKEMPIYTFHKRFVESKPYMYWSIVQLLSDKLCVNIGSVYITYNNEVGIHLLKEYQNLGYGKEILKYIIDSNPTIQLYANINPSNAQSIKLFTSAGFEHIQNVYKLNSSCADAVEVKV